jgi:hypothetical protein
VLGPLLTVTDAVPIGLVLPEIKFNPDIAILINFLVPGFDVAIKNPLFNGPGHDNVAQILTQTTIGRNHKNLDFTYILS